MRFSLLVLLFLAMQSSSSVMAAEASRKRCDTFVGVWEYVEPSRPGRAVIAKQGDKYTAVWVSTETDRKPTEPLTDAEKAQAYSTAGAAAADMTCGPTREKWRIFYSLRPQEVGAEFETEIESDRNGVLRWWFVRPDGTRGDKGAARRLK